MGGHFGTKTLHVPNDQAHVTGMPQDVKNETYKVNLNQLENLVLVMFSNDTMVVPRESSHFGFYAAGQDKIVVPLQQTEIYTGVSPPGWRLGRRPFTMVLL